MHWPPEVLRDIDAAIQSARDGAVAFLVIDGAPGMGKTSLLDEVQERATGFEALVAAAEEDGPAFDVLDQFGVDLASSGGAEPSSRLAAERLAARAGTASGRRILICIDDVDLADDASVDAVGRYLGRHTDGGVLLAVSARPRPHGPHPRWRRMVSPRQTTTIGLTRMAAEAAAALIAEREADVDPGDVDRLSEHVAGNPRQLRALLAEFEPRDLVRMRVLPATADTRRDVGERLSAIPGTALAVVQAAAVLAATTVAPDWSPLVAIAEVAGLQEDAALEAAVTETVTAGLLDVHELDRGTGARIPSRLMRAAVYAAIPSGKRREMHRRAVAVTANEYEVVEHRAFAATGSDDSLARDLEDLAVTHGGWHLYRHAADLLVLASGLSSAASERRRRWLESIFNRLLAHEVGRVRLERPAIYDDGDEIHTNLILALLARLEENPFDAVHYYRKWVADATDIDAGGVPAEVDNRTAYRYEVLLASLLAETGAPTALVVAGLDRARARGALDPAMDDWIAYATSYVTLRTCPPDVALASFADLPDNAGAVDRRRTTRLSARGIVRAFSGDVTGAMLDLDEAVDRVQLGAHEAQRPTVWALLGFAQWLAGDWEQARRSQALAIRAAGRYRAPMPAALAPLLDVPSGDLDRADAGIAAANDALERAPWVEAVDIVDIARVARAHAGQDAALRATVYTVLRPRARSALAGSETKGAPWLLHAGLAAIWSGDLGDATALANRLADAGPSAVPWAGSLAAWLAGLVAEARKEPETALDRLREATSAPGDELPLYRAHGWADLARVAQLCGEAALAASAGRQALERYQALDATPYLGSARLRTRQVITVAPIGRSAFGLTEREEEVLGLLAAGMSYDQIAGRLFITRRTVAYHLSNIYGKAGVRTRHELVALVRDDPEASGLGT